MNDLPVAGGLGPSAGGAAAASPTGAVPSAGFATLGSAAPGAGGAAAASSFFF